jgi:hypothetical protein
MRDPFASYDNWKLAYPPEWDESPVCEKCDKEISEDEIVEVDSYITLQCCQECAAELEEVE